MKLLHYILLLGTFLLIQFANAQPVSVITTIPPGTSSVDAARIAAHVVPSERQAAWQELEFTVFFHFGINTFAGLEWGNREIKADIFKPVSLDAGQWIRTAKEAGAKLVILVAKHHDGFCNWPSKFTEYSVKNSPWKNGKGDVVKEVSDACRKYGLKFGIYVSPWDINSTVYGSEEYNVYFKNLLTEVLTQYGTVDEVWFDGACGEGPNGKKQVYDWAGYYELIRRLQPGAVIAVMGPDVRWVGTESGYGRETEWSVVPLSASFLDRIASASQQTPGKQAFTPPGDMMQEDIGSLEKISKAAGLIWYPSEVDVSIRPGWFYHEKEDSLVKSPDKLVDIYFSSVGRNSVLLLNLPPDKRGLIHENDVKSLRGMRAILDSVFRKNLAKGASVTAANTHPQSKTKSLTDDNPGTFWAAVKGDTSATIRLSFKQPCTFSCLAISEFFRHGQRVSSFVLEVPEGDSWKPVASGTTIGYRRLLRFPPVTASEARIRIISARDNPEISEIGLYSLPARLIPVTSH